MTKLIMFRIFVFDSAGKKTDKNEFLWSADPIFQFKKLKIKEKKDWNTIFGRGVKGTDGMSRRESLTEGGV